ncbi:RagB/SusD family nutrient uptake outer membrane protein [Pinibacter aurantiacus]|uniref:RagB/SusD family nutrient uptake outer membrane protein n=1 Tax=Pinibacter aurantiacus TaxID=2851599 RepID=A0A9E2SAK7_9BACT|nr:RagB/SusD family nutrient uptake outer membrane protein [Pinibacter aurantiacus]MBV4356395.1 RagB/SusD family nutrient uptake outer membrane protein [Pinibacter aurantiacus]
MTRFKFIIIFSAVVLVTATSCKKWLDVQPKTKIKSEDLLRTEQGYKDALIGAYTMMTTESLYGRELSFGFFDALAKEYDATSNAYTDLVNGTGNANVYKLTTVRPRIDQFWGGLYNINANVNNILGNIDADSAIFTGNNYSIVKGEALALRAFLHLEVFKMFALNDSLSLTQPAIPYVKTLSTGVTKASTGAQVLAYVSQDLQDAATYLQKDPIINGQKKSSDVFLNDRNLRLNYYAVKGLQARTYMWRKDYVNALAAAQAVMSAGDQIFPWVNPANLISSDNKNIDFTFSTEHLFALNVFNLQTISNNWFISALTSGNQLSRKGRTQSGSSITYYYEGFFENTSINSTGLTDYRYARISDQNIMPADASSNYYVSKKYYQPSGYNSNYAARIPLLRRSEMNYIAAECILNAQGDYPTAVGYLNEVRRHRGITNDLASTLTPTTLRTEITKEYYKEFQGEGQFFFYAKRNRSVPVNFPTSVNSTGTWSYNTFYSSPSTFWFLPKPDNETEYNP